MNKIFQQMVHPVCEAEPRRGAHIAVFWVIVIITAMIVTQIWPSWWVIPIVLVVGLALSLHPLCYVTKHKHRAWRVW